MHDDNNHEVIEANFSPAVKTLTPPASLPTLDLSTPEKMELALTHVQNAMVFRNRVIELALKTADDGAIDTLDGKPYVSEAECERIFSLLGGGGEIQIVQRELVKDEDDSGHWGYEILVKISHPVLGTFDGLGFAHTTDPFLGVNKKRVLSEIGRHNMRQHAYTRAKGAAIRKMLGFGKLTWERLAKLGFQRGKGANVKYKSDKPRPAAGKRDPLKDELFAFVKNDVFSWDEVSEVQNKLSLKGPAKDLDPESMKKLVEGLRKKAAGLR